ncbi:hypothetical protein CANARDRAFT_7431 [[Candida] arabinofermentans NRRL YB-2248]|uniref:MoaB/Mog domain-containing protein n=1 Tax=[Candida] arabinofermentans NRRL YB-2248 TaxID=983967 RepID=A0A1E4T2S9_9ASCO|nr:hypothetical protein CANARDRAFT_7431 [[Candida] arabinofermentans NRRL YB-2248]
MPFNVGILILSDTCFKDKSADKTTSAIRELLNQYHDSYTVTKTSIIPDRIDEIQSVISNWTKTEDLRLILTCGGTGFTTNDVTPEAIKPMLEKEAPGIIHAMLTESFKITPFAMMARPVAGVRNKSLIITLPGSPKGSKENLSSIIKTLPHALVQLENTDARAIHKKMNRTLKDALPNTEIKESNSDQDQSHIHDHSHEGKRDKITGRVGCGVARHSLQSNDLNAPVTQRARESPYPIISVHDAYELIEKFTPGSSTVEIDIRDSLFTGCVIAEDIYSPVDVPNFRASIVDGYAVINSDGAGTYPIVSISHASAKSEERTLKSGEIARITTGAPVPQGANAVVMVEETQLVSQTEDGSEEKEVRILASGVEENDNIREVGSDLQKGALILAKGSRISAHGGEVGLLASVGIHKVKVFKKPTIGVLSTGDELKDVSLEGDLRYGEIYDSNRPTLISTIKNTGYEAVDLAIASDSKDTLETLIISAFKDHNVDYLITTGGVSMGEMDLLKPTIERTLGGDIHFGRVKMKPGKPTTFATIKFEGVTKVIFALPGNPASASVCYHVFVLPSILKFQGVIPKDGAPLPSLPLINVKLAGTFKLDSRRPEYQRVYVYQTGHMELIAESTGFQRSSRIGSFKGANGFLCLPSAEEHGSKTASAGSIMKALLIGPIDSA